MKSILRKIASIARFAIAFAIIAFLLYKLDMKLTGKILYESLGRWYWLVLSFFLYFICFLLGAGRWHTSLSVLDIRPTPKRSLTIYMIGHFFNAFMIGITGGDLARIYYTVKETRKPKTETIITIVMDRITGIVTLLLIAAVMLIVKRNFYYRADETRLGYWITAILILTVLCLTLAFICLRKTRPALALWLTIGKNYPKFYLFVQRILHAFNIYKQSPREFSAMLVLSTLAHLFMIAQCYTIGLGLGVTHLSFLDYLAVVPMVIIASSLPVTPGGLGVRELVAIKLLSSVGVPESQSLPLPLLIYLNTLIISLIGGTVFMFSSGSKSAIDLKNEITAQSDLPGSSGF